MPSSVVRLTVLIGAVCWLAMLPAAATAASYTTQIGRPGGTAFEITCPPGQVLVGIDYRSTEVIKALGGYCKAVDANGQPTGKLFGTNGYAGDLSEGRMRDPLYCRQNEVITKIAVGLNADKYVRLINFTCSPTTGTNTGTVMGVTKADGKGPNQISEEHATEDCRFGIGFAGAANSAGGTLYRVGLKCQPIAGPALPALPVTNGDGDDNADNGNNGAGTARAEVPTTIYDQKAGNDLAYLNAGDPVTIIACGTDNWCEISAPQHGWVWSGDLKR